MSTATIISISNAPSYENLEDLGLSYGASGNAPIPYTQMSGMGGISYIETEPDEYGIIYQGGEFVLGGLSAPASTSLNYQWSKSMTTTDFYFN